MAADKLDRTGTGSLVSLNLTVDQYDLAASALARLALRLHPDDTAAAGAELALTLGAIGYLPAEKALRASERFSRGLLGPEPREVPVEPPTAQPAAKPAVGKPRWCKCEPTKHDLNDPEQAVFRKNNSRECRTAVNARQRRDRQKRRDARRENS